MNQPDEMKLSSQGETGFPARSRMPETLVEESNPQTDS